VLDVDPIDPTAAPAVSQPVPVLPEPPAMSLDDVARVPSPEKTEPVPSEPTPAVGPGQVSPAVASVGAGLRPPAKSSVVPSGTPPPPSAVSAAFSPGAAGAAVLSIMDVPGGDMPGTDMAGGATLVCPKLGLHEKKMATAIAKRIRTSRGVFGLVEATKT
jgi:hypothetical protein